VALADVHTVGDPVQVGDVGRLVRVVGTFDADLQALVVDREHDEQKGSWVVTGLRVPVEGEGAALIPVVRGWLPEGQAAPEPPSGRQQITGVLEPSESDGLRVRGREPLPDGQLEIVSSAELLSVWQPPLYEGFVIQQRPDPSTPLEVVTPPSQVSVATDWQNAAYAIQWWVFGLFAVFWFGRMVRMEVEDREAALDTMDETDVANPGEARKDRR